MNETYSEVDMPALVKDAPGTTPGVTFNVRHVKPGDRYGRDLCLINKDNDLIEFYDARFPHTPLGQFVSRYNLDTLMEDGEKWRSQGLCLDMDIPDWNVSVEGMTQVYEAMRPIALSIAEWKGYCVNEDPDQPGKFYYRTPDGEGSDISYPSVDEAWNAVFKRKGNWMIG